MESSKRFSKTLKKIRRAMGGKNMGGKNWYVLSYGNYDADAQERMKHVRVFCLGLMVNEFVTLLAACTGLYVIRKNRRFSIFFHRFLTL